jgi:mono/diheme cytochrome c family protein
MNRWLIAGSLLALVVGAAAADDPKPARRSAQIKPAARPTADQIADGKRAFATIYKVLLSPRCRNCHPDGSRPLQTDAGTPHAMNISRLSFESGLECGTCHGEKNAEDYGIAGGPPGAPHWQLPPRETLMVFEGRTPSQLCRQLSDRKQNGGRSLSALYDHVDHDPLVLWGWTPGGDRSKPPVSHAAFTGAFKTWVISGGACP